MKPREPKPSTKDQYPKEAKGKPSRRIFLLQGPCGELYAQARSPDQARGVYLVVFPGLPRDLGNIIVMGEITEPCNPYAIIVKKRHRVSVLYRQP